MTQSKAEFQKRHGFDDEDMQRINDLKQVFNGAVVAIEPQKMGKTIENDLIRYNVHSKGL